MASGGARAFGGRRLDPDALRRDRDEGGSWTILPAFGRKGDTPEWPLSLHVDEFREDADAQRVAEKRDAREVALWTRQWSRPQAVAWEANGQEEEVALYVRAFADAEAPGATTASRTLVKQLQESLGLSLPGMLRLRWKIDATTDEEGQQHTSPAAVSGSARNRFRLVDGGGS